LVKGAPLREGIDTIAWSDRKLSIATTAGGDHLSAWLDSLDGLTNLHHLSREITP
jgi:hypothetical protein